jgi:uncharacterized protein (TIGR02391 family)
VQLHELIPDPEVVVSLEPEELGLRIIQTFPSFPSSFLHDIGGYQRWALGGEHELPKYPTGNQEDLQRAICEAWAWLESAVLLVPQDYINRTPRKLSRRGEQIARSSDPHRSHSPGVLRKDRIHPYIREDVWALFHREQYDTAVFNAMKAVEVAVREAACLGNDMIGVKLMRSAFSAESGPLTEQSAEMAERIARMELFAGSIGSYKNPQSHRRVALEDPDEVAEIVMLASHLLRIVDERRSVQHTAAAAAS